MSDNAAESGDAIERVSKENQKSYWEEKLEELKTTQEDFSSLSKNQQKKMLKQKLLMETRTERRKKERERKKVKRAEKKEAGLPLPESRQIRKRRKQECSNFKIAIDLDFYELMTERDHRMVLKQLKYCYSENRRSQHPLQLSITSFDTNVRDLFVKLQPGILNWSGLRMEPGAYSDVFDASSIVYLTSDSDNVLETLEEDKVYVIGGLVDHNHHKGLCYKRAVQGEFAHAQLPIGQYVKMSSRKVLTINHVFEILLEYSYSKDWREAFFKVLPNRKGASALEVADGKDEDEGEEEEEVESERSGEEDFEGENDRTCDGVKTAEFTDSVCVNEPLKAVSS